MKTKRTQIFVVGSHCFIPHPSGVRGSWMRTARAVAYVACPLCKAKAGDACHGASLPGHGRTSSVHTRRRQAYQTFKTKTKVRRGVVVTEELVE